MNDFLLFNSFSLLFLYILVLGANAANLFCDFKTATDVEYICIGNVSTTQTDYFVDHVTGNHLEGKRNEDIKVIVFNNLLIDVLPKNLKEWFVNYDEIAIVDVPNYPSLKRSQFYDFTYLTSIYMRNLSNTRVLPKDTFWDLPKMEQLYLDAFENLESLDCDLLIKTRSLRIFSARGPNKITQINQGFFRNQRETLKEVDFRRSNLISIGHSVFVNLQSLKLGRFHHCSCLHNLYKSSVSITADIRAQCKDIVL